MGRKWMLAVAVAAALWPEAARAQALRVHVPVAVKDLSREEAIRIAGADLSFAEYEGTEVRRAAGEIVLLIKDETPAEWRRERDPHYGAVAAADPERRLIFVFEKDLQRNLGLNRTDPLYRIALGRVIAHEVEHLRRAAAGLPPGHDESGWFRACPSRDEMTRLGWGPRSAEGRR